MAIDYIIDYDCIPKQELTTEGIIERLKGEERALTIIGLFREKGDDRPPSQMGFEFTRSTPDGGEEMRVILVQDLLDAAEQLAPLRHHCANCPANIRKKPFGCVGFIQYPISSAAESWLLDRLPVPDEPLIWMLLRQGIQEFKYDGESVKPLRDASNIYFESQDVHKRRLGEFTVDANQLFEMVFAVGHISPNHAALLLLFLDAVNREIEAETIMKITPAPPDAEERFPFKPEIDAGDDTTIAELKEFLRALYLAWRLNVRLILDV